MCRIFSLCLSLHIYRDLESNSVQLLRERLVVTRVDEDVGCPSDSNGRVYLSPHPVLSLSRLSSFGFTLSLFPLAIAFSLYAGASVYTFIPLNLIAVVPLSTTFIKLCLSPRACVCVYLPRNTRFSFVISSLACFTFKHVTCNFYQQA